MKPTQVFARKTTMSRQ